jgi:hypothetical protein
MSHPKKYMAASVPRFLRQTSLGYLPLQCVIGSRLVKGAAGANLFFDIIMLPVNEFQRMKNNVGLQHVIAPALKAGPAFKAGFVCADTKEVVVPADEPDPEGYARNYFMLEFGLAGPTAPAAESPLCETKQSPFSKASKECT